MRVRFQADADFNQNIVQAVRRRQAVGDLILIWEASEAEEWVNRLDSLPL